jgi:hypothetical protein
MKNFELNKEEKSRILSLHKRMIQEQTGPPAPNTTQLPPQIIGAQQPTQPTLDETNQELVKLRHYIKIGCLKKGEILSNKDYTKFIYRVVDNNVTYDIYADGTFKTNNNQSGTYTCKSFEDQYAANEKNLSKEIISHGWMTKDQTNATDDQLRNPQMWEKKVNSDGTVLYRSLARDKVVGGTTKDQIDIINSWTGNSWNTANNLTQNELKVAYKVLVSPKSDGVFQEDFYMYIPQSKIDEDLGQKKCNELIGKFFNEWDGNIRKVDGKFATEKLKVERCATLFKNRRIFGIGKTDDYLKVLKGEAKGGRSNSAPDAYSRFRLNNGIYKFDNR